MARFWKSMWYQKYSCGHFETIVYHSGPLDWTWVVSLPSSFLPMEHLAPATLARACRCASALGPSDCLLHSQDACWRPLPSLCKLLCSVISPVMPSLTTLQPLFACCLFFPLKSLLSLPPSNVLWNFYVYSLASLAARMEALQKQESLPLLSTELSHMPRTVCGT